MEQIIVIQQEQLKAIIDEAVNNVLIRTGLVKDASFSQKYYTREDLQELWNISKTTIWKFQKLGYIKPLHIGRKVVFDKEEIDKIDFSTIKYKKTA